MRKEVREFLLTLPYVTFLSRGRQCSGFMSKTALKHVFGTDAQCAQKPKCKIPAHWKFMALKNSMVEDGIYCGSHLFARGLYGDMLEEERTAKYIQEFRDKGAAA